MLYMSNKGRVSHLRITARPSLAELSSGEVILIRFESHSTLRTMKIKGLPVCVYDIEVFPNVFHCTVKDTENQKLYKFEISSRTKDIDKLVDYFYVNKNDHIMCGYNNHHYDDIIINYILSYNKSLNRLPVLRTNNSIYFLSQAVVKDEIERFKRWKYANYFYSFDLMTMLYSNKLQKSLKEVEILMGFRNVQEYEGLFTDRLTEDEIDSMVEYNINDVEATSSLLYKVRDEIDLRLLVEKEWGIDALSMSGVKFGETILLQAACRALNTTKKDLLLLTPKVNRIILKDVIAPFITFTNPKLKKILEDAKSVTIKPGKSTKKEENYEKKFVLSNTCYSIGEGGIHTINEPRIYKPKNGEYIGHADVTSMYPSLALINHWLPQHLGEDFWNMYRSLYEERLIAKHAHMDLKSTALKQALNSIIGKMQRETSWAYDPLNVYKIRMNGQFILLMLVERLLYLNCEIVQVNTDGVVYISKIDNRNAIQEAIREIENITKLSFETDEYEAFYQCAVNSYFGIRKGYAQSHDPKLIEKKGIFITELSLQNSMTPTVVAKAVIEYFLNKTPIAEFIKNNNNINDFLMSQSVGKEFEVEYANKRIQHINRFYASKNGWYLMKIKDRMYEKPIIEHIVDTGVTILNKLDGTPIGERKINYEYYIAQANKIVASLIHRQLELF